MEHHVLDRSTVRSLHRLRRRRTRGGFTLVELAIVVAIVGVLAVIALVGYRKYMLNSKISEARGVIGAIRIAQESHKSERGTYANIGTNWCPAGAGNGDIMVMWNSSCDGGSNKWQVLPVHVDGAVRFKYATVSGDGAAPASTTLISGVADYSAVTKVGPWFVVGAECDLDNDPSQNTQLIGSSYDNIIRSKNDGS